MSKIGFGGCEQARERAVCEQERERRRRGGRRRRRKRKMGDKMDWDLLWGWG